MIAYCVIIYYIMILNSIEIQSMSRETKEQRFVRIAEKRVQRVLDSLRSLSQTSNKRMYKWDDKQMKKIWDAIDHELKSCREAFEDSEPKEFKL